MRTASLIVAAGLTVTACASAPTPSRPPDFTPIASTPSANARLYADCIAQAAANGRYGHAFDEVHVVIFTCDGAPARAFFDALGPWAAEIGSEIVTSDRLIRPTTRIERDLFAADYCERQGSDYRCAISLRTGAFGRP